MQTTLAVAAPRLLLHLFLLLLTWASSSSGSSSSTDGTGFSIPADAVRVGARQLDDQQLTDHLVARLIGNSSASAFGIHHRHEQQQHLPAPLERLGALLRAAEQRKNRILNSSSSDGQRPRFLSINRSAYFRGLLIVWLPVSFVLPTLATRGHYDGPDIEGNYFSKRQLNNNNNNMYYEPNSLVYKFEPHYGPLLSRLEGYFDLMRIDNVHCRWKLVCHASRRPEAFEPLSSLFKRVFERGQKHSSKLQTYHPALKRYHSYAWADKKGAKFESSDQCDDEYRGCPLAPASLVRTDVLEFWQKLSERFAIQLQDE